MYRFVTAVGVLLLVSPALAGDFDSGSDGSDGALNCETLGLTDCENTCTGGTPCAVPEFVTGMNKFQKDVGLVKGDFAYDQVVATEFSEYWS